MLDRAGVEQLYHCRKFCQTVLNTGQESFFLGNYVLTYVGLASPQRIEEVSTPLQPQNWGQGCRFCFWPVLLLGKVFCSSDSVCSPVKQRLQSRLKWDLSLSLWSRGNCPNKCSMCVPRYKADRISSPKVMFSFWKFNLRLILIANIYL